MGLSSLLDYCSSANPYYSAITLDVTRELYVAGLPSSVW
jgi:hypothetical protein